MRKKKRSHAKQDEEEIPEIRAEGSVDFELID